MTDDNITRVREAMVQQDRELADLFERFRDLDPALVPATFAEELEAALEPKPTYGANPWHHALRA